MRIKFAFWSPTITMLEGASRDEALPAAHAAAAQRQVPAPLRVLFVEDSAFDASLLARLLTQSGFQVRSERVEDEASMRAALAAQPWDAVISDHNLPNFNALGALRVFKQAALDIPFLIVSGEIGEDVAVEAMLAGADDYILKSRLARLAPALARSFEAAESRRRRRGAERALTESESQLRSITANIPGIVFQIRRDAGRDSWHFEYVSEGAHKLFGVSAGDLMNDPDRFLGLLSPRDRRLLEETLAASERNLEEARWQGKLGTGSGALPRWVEMASTPGREADGGVFWQGVIMDITPQKMAEEALTRSREDLRALSLHLEKVKEEERKAIAREIHDDIGGIITSLKFDIAWLRSRPAVPEEQLERLSSMESLLYLARQASDRIARDLRPSVLDQGIVAALEWLTRDFEKRYSVATRFHSNRDAVALADAPRTVMFRICQEALTNIAKHAGATCVGVELFCSRSDITLEIADNGAGMGPTALAKEGRFGVRGMRERAASLGGWLEVSSVPEKGTTVMLSLPAKELKR